MPFIEDATAFAEGREAQRRHHSVPGKLGIVRQVFGPGSYQEAFHIIAARQTSISAEGLIVSSP